MLPVILRQMLKKRQFNINKIVMLIFGICFILVHSSFGQTYNLPNCNSQATPDLKILKITRNDNSTIIDFEYMRTEKEGIYIFLNAANTHGIHG